MKRGSMPQHSDVCGSAAAGRCGPVHETCEEFEEFVRMPPLAAWRHGRFAPMLAAPRAPDIPLMGEYLLWLLVGTGLCLLVGWQILGRRADSLRNDEQAGRDATARAELQRQAELRAEDERLDAERVEAQRIEVERQREAAERAERERVAVQEAEREARRLAAEQAARQAEARAEAQRQAERRAEEERLAAQRAEAGRLAADLRREATERAERERVAALEAEREVQRLAAEQAAQAAREAQARAEALRLAEIHTEQVRAAAERAEAERATVLPRRTIKGAAQTLVLVADDSKVVRIKTGRLLAQHQYQVAYANDGLDAVQQMEARLPDVVITDVEMPGMDGFELTRHIRGNAQTAQLPVIMITAADDRHREQADSAGVSVLLGKPYPEDALIAHIRLAMGQDDAMPLRAASSAHSALDALA